MHNCYQRALLVIDVSKGGLYIILWYTRTRQAVRVEGINM